MQRLKNRRVSTSALAGVDPPDSASVGRGGAASRLAERAASPLLVSAACAARLLSISERTLRDRTKDGTIPALRLEGRVLYSPKALADWVERRLSQSNPKA